MNVELDAWDDRSLVAALSRIVDTLTDDRLRLPSNADLMATVLDSLTVVGRLVAWQQQALVRLDAAEATWDEYKASTITWLVGAARLTPREARHLLAAGHGLTRFPLVEAATLAGDVSPAQAEAITSVLTVLPDDVATADLTTAQETMIGFAADFTSAELRRLSSHLLDVICPDTADVIEAKRLERELAVATERRYLDYRPDGRGSILIRGRLPQDDAEPLVQALDAHVAAHAEADDQHDHTVAPPTAGACRADALMTIGRRYLKRGLAPVHGGIRPRVTVTLSYDQLLAQYASHHRSVGAGGHATGSGEPIPPSVLRQILCDADLLPVVLGGEGEILDVGRTKRLVTSAIRTALEIRDHGCVFPGCDATPADCDAHHITPWWAGGLTSMTNLVLVCPHHHGVVEPARPDHPDPNRWRVRLGDTGLAEIIPPLHVDPAQGPRRHARFHPRR